MQTTERTALTSTPTRPAVPRGRARAWLLGVALIGAGLDVVTKILAVRSLTPGRPVELLGGLLHLHLIRNPGAAFSLGENATPLFAVLATAAAVFILAVLLPRVAHRGWAVTLGLLLAGVLGNLADRLFRPPGFLHGHVVDFLELPHWPIFNVADMCVTAAAVGIVGLSLFSRVGLDGRPADDPEPR